MRYLPSTKYISSKSECYRCCNRRSHLRQARRHLGPTTVHRNFESDVRWSKAGPLKGSMTKTSWNKMIRNTIQHSSWTELTSSPWMKVTVLVGDTFSTAASWTQAGAISAAWQALKASERASDTVVSSRPSGMTNLEFQLHQTVTKSSTGWFF